MPEKKSMWQHDSAKQSQTPSPMGEGWGGVLPLGGGGQGVGNKRKKPIYVLPKYLPVFTA